MKRFWNQIIEPLLEALQPAVIVEIGSDKGGNTRNLLEFCEKTDAVLHVVDPAPKYDVAEWQQRYGDRFIFYKDLSLNALPEIENFDVVFIDGDHNWYTVYNELKLIEEFSDAFPLVLLHDIDWPYGRRDLYYDPDTIPEGYRKPYTKKGLRPDSEGMLEKGGLNQQLYKAVHEGGSRNGVFTAVEDFMQETGQEVDLIRIPGFHGLGILIPAWLRENEVMASVLKIWHLPPAVLQHIERLEKTWLEAEIQRQEQHSRLNELSGHREQVIEKLRAERRETAEVRQQLREVRRRLMDATRRVPADSGVERGTKKTRELAILEIVLRRAKALIAQVKRFLNREAKTENPGLSRAEETKGLRGTRQEIAKKNQRLKSLRQQITRKDREVETLRSELTRVQNAPAFARDSEGSFPVFFIVGWAKSGTSWLMRMLNSHPEILCRGEGRFFGRGADLGERRGLVTPTSLYGAFADSDYLRTWVERSVWARGDDVDRHLNDLTRKAIKHFLGEKLAASGKQIVGDKTPFVTEECLEEIKLLMPEAKVIHIIRDGRDIAVSSMHHMWNNAKDVGGHLSLEPEALAKRDAYRKNPDAFLASGKSIFHGEYLRGVAESWRSMTGKAVRTGPALLGENYTEARYEDLLERPLEEIMRLLQFLGTQTSEELVQRSVEMSSFKRVAQREKGEENSSSFFRKGVAGDWRNVFTEEDKRIFKETAGDLLIRLGYEEDEDW